MPTHRRLPARLAARRLFTLLALPGLLALPAALVLPGAPARAGDAPAYGPPSAEALALAARFGALDAVAGASLSPDGQHLGLIMPEGAGTSLAVFDIAHPEAGLHTILRITKPQERLASCHWPTDSRLLCQVAITSARTGLLMGYSRLIAVNADGSALKLVTATTGVDSGVEMQFGGNLIDWNVPEHPGAILVARSYIPDNATRSLIHSDSEGLGVDAVDTLSLQRWRIEQPRRDADDYITDGQGHVRILSLFDRDADGYVRNTSHYRYRRPGSDRWEVLSDDKHEPSPEAAAFEPLAIDAAANRVLGFADNHGFRALYAIALDGSLKRDLVLAKDGTDIDQLITIGRQRRVVGVSYATQMRQTQYFDPALGALAAGLSRALPGQPSLTFMDASQDENRLLAVASGDTDPGTLYLFDRTSHQLSPVTALRPELQGLTLAPMRPITYEAADGTKVPAYLTLPVGGPAKGLPAIVMPHGGPGARDEWGFDWLVQYFAARGFAVLQPNYRGSAGYGADWYQHNGFRSWRVAVGDVNDAGRWLVREGIAAPDRLAIVGWSYGGYAALQSQVLDAGLFKAVVAVAPVTDLASLREESANFTNYRQMETLIGSGDYIAEASPARHADRFKAPVLLFHGTLDRNVAVAESRVMKQQLAGAGKPVTYVEFPGLDHYLDDPAARTRLLSESDAFLRKALALP